MGIFRKEKFAGEDYEDELGKNTVAYQWRDYDPAIARFSKIDRFAEKYYAVSNYAFVGNNPILNREIAGDSIGKGKEHFNRLRQTAVDRKQKTLNKRSEKLAKAKGNGKKTAKLKARYARQDANSNSTINRLANTITELDALESSGQVFNFITNSSDVNSSTGTLGNIMYDDSNGEININLGGGYNSALFAHEAKHAYQFLERKISFSKTTGHGGELYDLQDEVEAYRRQDLFGGGGRTFSEIRNDPNYKGIRNRTTQRTINSLVQPQFPNTATYRMQLPRFRGTASEQIYIEN